MICPYCGKHTSNFELCDFCGHSTEFVRKTHYQSIGTSANAVEMPPVPKKEPVSIKPECDISNQSALRSQLSHGENKLNDNETNPQAQIPSRPIPRNNLISMAKETCKSRSERLVLFLSGTVSGLLILCIIGILAFSLLLGTKNKIPPEDTTIPTDDAISDYNATNSIEETDTGELEPMHPNSGVINILLDLNLSPGMEKYSSILELPQFFGSVGKKEVLPNVIDPQTGRRWIFTGWNTERDGTGYTIQVSQIMNRPLDGGTVLYAQWEEILAAD